MSKPTDQSKGRKVLESLSEPLHARIAALTAAQLFAARSALDELTTTNCGWFLFQCRGLLRQAIDEWLIDRLGDARCDKCHGAARVQSDLSVICADRSRDPTKRCGAARRARPDELAELHELADRKWATADGNNPGTRKDT